MGIRSATPTGGWRTTRAPNGPGGSRRRRTCSARTGRSYPAGTGWPPGCANCWARAMSARRPGGASGSSTPGATPAPSTACSAPRWVALGDGEENVLVDPMAIDPSGLTTLDAWQPDKEGRLLAYQLSEGGDEESLLRVIDVTTGSLADGPIDRCRYSNVAWLPGGKAFYYTRRLPPEVAAGRGEPVPPAGLPAPGRRAGGRGRAHLRRGPGQDRLLRRLGQPGRAVAGHLGVAGHGAAQRPVDRRPVRIRPRNARPAGDPGGNRRADRRPGRPGRAALRVHRPRRAARPDRGDRPRRLKGPHPGHLARPDRRGPRGGAERIRHPGRGRAGPAGPAGRVDQARGQRDHRARPGHAASGWARCRCPASAPWAGPASGPRAGTRRGSSTPTTRRPRWCCGSTRGIPR